MFIAHGERVRKHAKIVLGLFAVLMSVSLVGYFTRTGGRDREETSETPSLRGKPIDAAEFAAAKQAVRDQFVMRGQQMPNTPGMEDMLAQQALQRIILLRKAQEYGLKAPVELVESAIRAQFTNRNGEYNPESYRQFMQLLAQQQITPQRYEKMVREEVLMGMLQDMVGSTAKVTPQEVELSYAPVHEKLSIDLVRFDAPNVKTLPAVNDKDVQDHYEKNKRSYTKPPVVKVRYARFGYDEIKKTLKITESEIQDYYDRNKDRFVKVDTNTHSWVTNSLEQAKGEIRDDLAAVGANRKAGELAHALYLKLAPDSREQAAAPAPATDFAQVAAAAGAQVGETDYFSDAPKDLKAGRAFTQAAFLLAADSSSPFSDPVQGEDGYYVLQFLDKKPQRVPELAEVKAEVVEEIQRQRAYDAAQEKGRKALDDLRKLMADGKTFAAAATELKLKTEAIGPFEIADNKLEVPGARQIGERSLSMATNSVSDYIQTSEGGVFFHLRDRQPFDRAEFEKQKGNIERLLLQRAQQAMVQSWFGSVVRDEQVNFSRRQRPAAPAQQPEVEEQPEPAAK